jgi:hypothetical protein
VVQKSRKGKDWFSVRKDWSRHPGIWISIVIGIVRFGTSGGLPPSLSKGGYKKLEANYEDNTQL